MNYTMVSLHFEIEGAPRRLFLIWFTWIKIIAMRWSTSTGVCVLKIALVNVLV